MTNGEIIQIHIGQAGIQIGNACWEQYMLEHGIVHDGCMTIVPSDDSFLSLFKCAFKDRVMPRVVMVDTEPSVIDEVRSGPLKNLFGPKTLVNGKDDSGSNYARGKLVLGETLINPTMEALRQVTQDCNNLRGFILFRSIGGGTGSGFGTLLLEKISEEYGRVAKMEFVIFPSPTMSPLIVEPYNAVLATHTSMTTSDCSFILDNEAIFDICTKNLEIVAPSYTHLNQVIGQVVSAFTASQRFSSNPAITIQELQTNLVPYPRIHFPLVTYAPLLSIKNSTQASSLSSEALTLSCFRPGNQMIRCNPLQGKYMSNVLLYRGDISPTEVYNTISYLRQMDDIRFVDWSPAGFKVGINEKPPIFIQNADICPTTRSVCLLSNNTIIRKSWCRILRKFNRLYSRKAFFHHYTSEGLEEDQLIEAYEDICTLAQDYLAVQNESPNSALVRGTPSVK